MNNKNHMYTSLGEKQKMQAVTAVHGSNSSQKKGTYLLLIGIIIYDFGQIADF